MHRYFKRLILSQIFLKIKQFLFSKVKSCLVNLRGSGFKVTIYQFVFLFFVNRDDFKRYGSLNHLADDIIAKTTKCKQTEIQIITIQYSPERVPLIRPLLTPMYRAWVRKSRYWGEMLLSPIRCCYVTKPPPTCSVVNYVLHPCTLIACKCTPSAVRAAVSASLCSEHAILT